MAKRKKRSRRPGLVNRLANAALLALAFAQPIRILMGSGTVNQKVDTLLAQATGGISKGRPFTLQEAMEFYGPVGLAFLLFEVKKMALRKVRV
jgi:hypothetical protein